MLWLCLERITVSSKYLFNSGSVIQKHIAVKDKTGHFEKDVHILVDDILRTGIICAFHKLTPGSSANH
jgi:hypothetical protein